MIVSFKHKFIFIAIPKTASHSFREALRPHLGVKDWEQCHLLVRKRCPVEHLAKARHGHFTSLEIQPFLLPGMWEKFFRFCTVRNPFQRYVSHCCFIYRKTTELKKDPLGLMKRVINLPEHRVAFRPQSDYIFDRHDQKLVSYVCRIERLQEDFTKVGRALGLSFRKLEHVNVSVHDHHASYYDCELEDMIREKYERDFRLLDYSSRLE